MVKKYLSSTSTNELRVRTLESSFNVVVLLTCLSSFETARIIVSVGSDCRLDNLANKFLSVRTPTVFPFASLTGNWSNPVSLILSSAY